ncbi:sensor histidine kinase [Flavobacterium sp. RSSA_27]|uniref:sensor histidine kinase n=1 Tax=Flavobacterium sp. RSSA_27 TaxID=3447667 RepID=UPI003F3E20CC
MKINRLNSIIIIGLIAIIGILVAQLLWTKEAFRIEEKKFSQKAHIALYEVAKNLYNGNNQEIPVQNPVQKISNDYYIVNVENDFDASILEFYLKSAFKKLGVTTDFEYAIYNCQSDEMVYGNYVSLDEKQGTKHSIQFPKHKNLVYYFAIRFPNETSFLFSSLKFWFVLSLVLVLILLIYVYSIYTLLQQKKYSDLQRDFINNMTHEFKTPLSSILIASNYLSKQKPITDDGKLEKYTQIIVEQGNKLNQQVEKILTVAKSDATPLQLQKTTFEFLPIIKEIIENCQLKHPKVVFHLDNQSSKTQLYGDVFHFSNIIYNLVDNAIKYCEKTPEIILRFTNTKQHLQIDCIDNGIGIETKKIPFIFDKFYRIPSKKSNEINGFGLGLYYVKKICDLHHWKIVVTNNTSKGINVTLLLPI